jgi:geranylgeranyl pyrophosphate synthase
MISNRHFEASYVTNDDIAQKLGLATSPVLFAMRHHPHLESLIRRNFKEPGDVEKAMWAVRESDGLERTRELAAEHCTHAIESLKHIRDSKYKSALLSLSAKVLTREK